MSGANSGILLDGLLRADGSGIINMDGGAGVNNFIEYSASGNATLEIAGDAQLTVGSQIRRGTSNPAGVLRYEQTGGTVVAGKNAAPDGNRGVFEVLNTGSRFTHTGGTLTVVRPQSAATEATLLLEPSISSTGDATLHIGNAETPAGSIFTIKSSIALGNLDVDGSSIARLKDRSLVINRDLTIGAGSSFDGTGDFNLTVNRHTDNQGTANLNVDTLFLTGTSAFPSEGMQDISGDITVKRLVVEPELSVSLQPGSNVEITGNLFINSGQLIDGGNTITLKGNITNNASHVSSDPNAGGLLFGGSSLQRVYGSGQFGRLEVDNTQKVQLENSIHLNNHLTLTSGIFHIQHHRLSLGQNAEVVSSNPFGPDRMVAVYGGGFTPLGLRKYIPTIANGTPADPYDPSDPAYTWHFTFPVGTDDGTEQKYLPMDLHVASNAAGGQISVVPVDELHITFSDPVQEDHILHQYWNIICEGLSGFTALHLNHYTQDAVFGAEEDYIGARLFEGFWTKYFESDDPPIEVVYEDENYIAFIHSDVDCISGDYTAGEPDYIPDEVPVYYSTQDGSWTDPGIWERSDGGVVPAGGPVGQRMHIRTAHTVTIPANYRRAYETRINGTLELGTTINHILGYVKGYGILATETSSVPAGDYQEFFGCGGGIMQYGGTGSYTLSDRYTHYNNLTITGSGTKTLPDADLTICSDLTIEGNAILNTVTDRNIDLYGNIIKGDNAKFYAEYSAQSLSFRSALNQEITGSYTQEGDRLNNLYLYQDKNVTLNGPVHVRRYLGLNDGSLLFSTRTNLITLDLSNAGIQTMHAGSFVSGPLRSNITHGRPEFIFPVGRGGNKKVTTLLNISHTSGSKYWQAEYNNTSAGYEGKDPGEFHEDLEAVSSAEYWVIEVAGLTPNTWTFAIDEVRDNLGTTGTVYGLPATVSVYLVPESFLVTGGGDICGPVTTTIDLDGSEIGVSYQLYRDTEYFGITLEGTGGPLIFTGIDQEGTYTVRGYNVDYVQCFNWMTGAPEVSIVSSATAEITALLSDTPACEGDEVEIEITFGGIPPFTFSIEDNHGGVWNDIVVDTGDLSGDDPYTYNFTIPDPPVWTGPDMPAIYTYEITYIEDDSGCGEGAVPGPPAEVEVYKIPETGPQYHIPNIFGN